MKKILQLVGLGCLLPMFLASASLAETVVEKVARTGFLTVGTRFDAIPYSYINDKGELVGYSMDVLERIRKRLETRLGRPVTLQMIEANQPGEKINLIRSGEIDIACSTAFTWERAKVVDFSISYSISGIRILAKKGSNLSTPQSLIGKRIALVPTSAAVDVIKLVQPQATIVTTYSTIEEAIEALKTGKIDAIAGDSISLAGTILRDNPKIYEIVPEEALANFGIACMVPENNSTFLDDVNYAIVKMMQDYITNDTATVSQIDRWFGSQGMVPIPPELLKGFFAFKVIEHAQINPQEAK
ncbi:MAG: amino acid ABC transporter substrate-binding protein [Microcystis wesenbergii TW10]|jgi:polar amino acid transport system substrate-binding protein|uniref:Solute-binding protein family 3/N-terminal domain-containing protein n=4 Tax=Microcystis TaxID=1125 RepID=A0A0A1VZW9_MICAE|nr:MULTISPECIES: extracellular substrate binding-like orphan protein GrrP [Microcystis]REJ49043.1 MAG: amino acid ABC transporter substrate-binding protein [Microcystis wesenbergii TW10]TRT85163.1 MAG: amino acid ABC transporter substrate-binding protein [Microcystis aeruginosa Ma_OC_H_19870700_S124]MBD2115988.1 transporter substrate-binding domain-containing protein [Microcystis wesenbergii FACHB-1339]MCZ8038285.1 extracellular substrate binding-like orphan protein GrrP [Microcystis sp. LE17-2